MLLLGSRGMASRHGPSRQHRITMTEPAIESTLQQLCQLPGRDSNGARARFTEAQISYITDFVKLLDKLTMRPETIWWSHRPRIYTILCAINALPLVDQFAKSGINDISLPFEYQTLPSFMDDATREAFLDGQESVLSRDKETIQALEVKQEHVSFSQSADEHFISTQHLGSGSFGIVDAVCSKLTRTWYARKKMQRRPDSEQSRERQGFVEQEIALLKRLRHRHLIRIGGSYTDPQCVAYLMEPLASCNLSDFLETHHRRDAAEQTAEKRSLRSFFGCLAGAVDFLHGEGIRHRDLKPQNVLVHEGGIYVADFGAALDWSKSKQSVTQDRNVPTTREYMAPEAARGEEKGTASDMWSLGIVFLDIFTVLTNNPLSKWKRFLERKAGHRDAYAYQYLPAVREWLNKLSGGDSVMPRDTQPAIWIEALLKEKPEFRLRSKLLIRRIIESEESNDFCCWQCRQDFRTESFFEENAATSDMRPLVHRQQSRLDEIMRLPSSDMPQRQMSSEKAQSINNWLGLTGTQTYEPEGVLPFPGEGPMLIPGPFVHSPASSVRELSDIEQENNNDSLTNQTMSTSRGYEASLFNTIEDRSSDGDDALSIDDRVDSPMMNTGPDLDVIHEENEAETLPVVIPELTIVPEKSHGESRQSVLDNAVKGIYDVEAQSSMHLKVPQTKSSGTKTRSRSASPRRSENQVAAPATVNTYLPASKYVPVDNQVGAPKRSRLVSGASPSTPGEDSKRKSVHFAEAISSIQIFERDHGHDRENDRKNRTSKGGKTDQSKDNDKTAEKEVLRTNDKINSSPATKERPPIKGESKSGRKNSDATTALETRVEIAGTAIRVANPGSTTKDDVRKSGTKPNVEPTKPLSGPAMPNPTASLTENATKSQLRPQAPTKKAQDDFAPKHTPMVTVGKTKKQTDVPVILSTDDDRITKRAPKKSAQLSAGNLTKLERQTGTAADPAHQKKTDSVAGSLAKGEKQTTTPANVSSEKKESTKSKPKKDATKSQEPDFDPATFIDKAWHGWEIEPGYAASDITENSRRILFGSNLTTMWDRQHELLEHWCKDGKVKAVRTLLERGCNPGRKRSYRPKPLLLAIKGCSRKHNQIVQTLIEAHCDVNAEYRNKTPIHWAIERSNFDGYNQLLGRMLVAGALMNEKDGEGEYPLLKIFGGAEDRPLEDYKIEALAIVLSPEVRTFVDLNVHQPISGNTALHLAVQRRSPLAVALLIHRGANVNVRNKPGTTPLLMAANQWRSQWSADQEKILLSLLKAPEIDIDASSGSQAHTALHNAVIAGRTAAVKILLKHGANPLLKDKSSNEPLDAKGLLKKNKSSVAEKDFKDIETMLEAWKPAENGKSKAKTQDAGAR